MPGRLSLFLALSALLVLASLVPAPPALATHGGSHDPSPSAPDCEWYGSAEHDAQQDVEQEGGYTSKYRELGSGWSGPSDDSTCRGTVEYSYTQHDTAPGEAWWHQEGEGTVSATYDAGWASWGPPGTFAVYFYGAEPVTMVMTDYSGGEGTGERPAGTQGGCVVPGAETAAKQASLQAVVITCSQIEEPGSPDQSWTATIRMRRAQCDVTVDSDGDDLADCTEFAVQTEPHNPDTDGDVLNDGREVLSLGTDPRDPDTDDGGVSDGEEVGRGTNPLDGTDDDLVTLTSGADPAEHGTLSGCRSTCAGRHERGVILTLAVTPDPGWRLVHVDWRMRLLPANLQRHDGHGQAGEVVFEEVTECNNLVDDDLDGTVDLGNDRQCADARDDDECGTLLAPHVRGVRPAWRSGVKLALFENYDAMCAATWVPQIDKRFVPQGLALRGGGSVLISGYTCHLADSGAGCKKESKKTEANVERCRLMSVQLSTGKVTANRYFSRGQCKHGGGVAVAPDGRIWIADTNRLVVLKGIHDKLPKTLKLRKKPKQLKAAFLTQTPSGKILLGEWADKGKPRIRAYTWEKLKKHLGEKTRVGSRRRKLEREDPPLGRTGGRLRTPTGCG